MYPSRKKRALTRGEEPVDDGKVILRDAEMLFFFYWTAEMLLCLAVERPSVVEFELEAGVDGAKKEGHQPSQEIICN